MKNLWGFTNAGELLEQLNNIVTAGSIAEAVYDWFPMAAPIKNSNSEPKRLKNNLKKKTLNGYLGILSFFSTD